MTSENIEWLEWLVQEAAALIGNPDNGHGECQTMVWQEAARTWRGHFDYWGTSVGD